jgi:hypothetical protein
MSYLDGDGLYGNDKNTEAFHPNGMLATADGVAIASGNFDELVIANTWTVGTTPAATYASSGAYALTPGIYDIYLYGTMAGAAGCVGQLIGFSADAVATSFSDLVYGVTGMISYNQSTSQAYSDFFVIKSFLVTANTNYYSKVNAQAANGGGFTGTTRIIRKS